MKVLRTVKHLLLVALLVNGLALAACDSSSGDPSGNTDVVDPGGDTTCTANCTNRECGPDPVCRESCGTCADGWSCNAEGTCVQCTPDCTGLVCGPDPICGESCGTCPTGQTCSTDGTVCIGDCAESGCGERECGPDPNCPGYYCGDLNGECASGSCNADGMCECTPNCTGRVCGDDGCGGSCGTCDTGYECQSGACIDPNCLPGTACFDWYDCANACPSGPSQQQCWIECDDALRPAALEAKNAFVDCQTNQCGHCADNDCLNDCIESMCMDSYNECLITYACGTGTCADWYSCLNACPDPDVNETAYYDCQEDCNRASSEQGMRDVLAIQDCLRQHCPSTLEGDAWVDCANDAINDEEQCATEAKPCFGGGSFDFCDPTTDDCLNCSELMSCLNSCASGDQECYNACFEASSQEAYDDMQEMYDCIYAECPDTLGEDEWTACANAAINEGGACETEAQPCFGGSSVTFCDPSTEECLDCSGLMSCLNACASGDQTCYNACFEASSEEAYNDMQEMYDCIYAECPDTLGEDAWTACANTAINAGGACETEAQPCFGGGTTVEFCDPTTETCLDCAGLYSCLGDCSDQTCYNACFESSSEAAYDQLQEMYDCFYNYCPETLGEDEWVTCANNAANDAGQCQAEATPCLSAAKSARTVQKFEAVPSAQRINLYKALRARFGQVKMQRVDRSMQLPKAGLR